MNLATFRSTASGPTRDAERYAFLHSVTFQKMLTHLVDTRTPYVLREAAFALNFDEARRSLRMEFVSPVEFRLFFEVLSDRHSKYVRNLSEVVVDNGKLLVSYRAFGLFVYQYGLDGGQLLIRNKSAMP